MANADPHILVREFDEEYLQRELLNSKFRNFAKEKFLNLIQFDVDYIDFLRRISIQEAFKLPIELNDYQIRIDTAPLFWLSDANILEKAEELFLNKNKQKPNKKMETSTWAQIVKKGPADASADALTSGLNSPDL